MNNFGLQIRIFRKWNSIMVFKIQWRIGGASFFFFFWNSKLFTKEWSDIWVFQIDLNRINKIYRLCRRQFSFSKLLNMVFDRIYKICMGLFLVIFIFKTTKDRFFTNFTDSVDSIEFNSEKLDRLCKTDLNFRASQDFIAILMSNSLHQTILNLNWKFSSQMHQKYNWLDLRLLQWLFNSMHLILIF